MSDTVELAGQFRGKAFVLVGHFDQRLNVAAGRDGLFQRFDNSPQRLELADRGLGLLLIRPEIGGRHPLFDGLYLSLFTSVVKESLVVGRSAPEWTQPDR